MDFSLIIPCFNEAHNVPRFYEEATTCLDGLGVNYELLFIDDGSTDDTEKTLFELLEKHRLRGANHSIMRVVSLSRNFGKEAALFAGLERACGECMGFIDADLQQDPQVACEMFEILKESPDIDCVAAVQHNRLESLPLRCCKKLFYRMFNAMGETRILTDVSDFRVFRRSVACALLSMREQFRFSKGLFAWVGFRTKVIPYNVRERFAGTSQWTLRKLVSYGWNGVLAFSTWPLKIVMYSGIVLALVSLAFFGWDLFDKIAYNIDIPLSQIILYVVLLMGGIQMFVLGLFGEYMARAYIEAKHRPVYLVRKDFSSACSSSDGRAEDDRTEMLKTGEACAYCGRPLHEESK